MSEKIYVFAAKYPFGVKGKKVFPAAREEEIASTHNERVRAEKYYVWKLLERALHDVYGLDIKDLAFTRDKNGKWRADGVEFSLAHSGGVVAVALGRIPVGVDVEALDAERFSRLFAEKILTEGERARGEGENALKKCVLWTKKEAIFKCMGGNVFRPETVESDALPVSSALLSGEDPFFLSVAAKSPFELCFCSLGGDIPSEFSPIP